MPVDTFSQNLINLLINLSYAIVTLILSVVTLYLIDKFMYKNIDFIEEIKKGNIAASIFFSVVLMFIAVVVTTAVN